MDWLFEKKSAVYHEVGHVVVSLYQGVRPSICILQKQKSDGKWIGNTNTTHVGIESAKTAVAGFLSQAKYRMTSDYGRPIQFVHPFVIDDLLYHALREANLETLSPNFSLYFLESGDEKMEMKLSSKALSSDINWFREGIKFGLDYELCGSDQFEKAVRQLTQEILDFVTNTLDENWWLVERFAEYVGTILETTDLAEIDGATLYDRYCHWKGES